MDFKDKVVLISGATGGIGEEIVKQLAKKGSKLAIFSRRTEKLEEICKEVSKQKIECIYRRCDVKNKNDIKEAVDLAFDKFGRIDIAILTSGILVPNPIETFDSSIIINTMEVNFFGYVYFIEQLFPIMKKQKSSVIAVTSTLPDRRGLAGWGAYGSSKAAISWLIESLRPEARKKYNIKFITIKPGSVETPMIDGYTRKGAVTPEKAAQHIIYGIKKGKRVIQFPFGQTVLNRLLDFFPAAAYDGLDIDGQKGEGYPVIL